MGTIGTNFSENGLNPFVDMVNLKFRGSLAKSSHVFSVCFHALLHGAQAHLCFCFFHAIIVTQPY
jgi:hypothetical protein